MVLEVDLGKLVMVVAMLLSPGVDMDNVILYLGDQRQSLLMQLLHVSSRFATDLLPCYLTMDLHFHMYLYFYFWF